MSQFPLRDSPDVDGLDDEGIQWPSADAHLRPNTNSHISYIVSVAACTRADSKETARTRLFTSPPTYQEPQGVSPISNYSWENQSDIPPALEQQRDPDKKLTMDDWDPMKEDFESKKFNSYNKGPAAGLSGRPDSNMSHQRSDTWHRLHIGGLPKEMSEDGLAALVGQVCPVQKLKVINPTDETKNFSFGFCNVATAGDVEKVMTKLNGYQLKGHTVRVNLATPKQDNRGSGSGASPYQSQTMNNNTMQNSPVTPRSFDNRYGNKAVPKSPSSPQTMPWDSQGTESKPMQNGTQSNGDETKQNAPSMVPMSVTRNVQGARQEATMPSKGRGQILQSMQSGNPPRPPGMTDNVSCTASLDKKHEGLANDMFQNEKEQQDYLQQQSRSSEQQTKDNDQVVQNLQAVNQPNPAGLMNNASYSSSHDRQELGGAGDGFQNEQKQNNMQQGRGSEQQRKGNAQLGRDSEQMRLDRNQCGLQEDFRNKQPEKSRGNFGTSEMRGRNQSSGMQSRSQSLDVKGKIQSSDMKARSQSVDMKARNQPSDVRGQNQLSNANGRMQQSRGYGKVQPRNDKSKRIQAARKQNTNSNRSNGLGNGKRQIKPLKQLQLQRKQDVIGKEKKTKEVQYVIVDENNKVEYIGVLEECSEKMAQTAATPIRSGDAGGNVAQVLHLETRSPPTPYREIPDTYPGVHGPPPAPYSYGPYPPPPWHGGGFYGYYPPDPMAMDYWRHARPPPPNYYHPRSYRPRYAGYPENQSAVTRYRSRMWRGAYRGHTPYGYGPQFPAPHPGQEMQPNQQRMQIKELRSPSPSPNKDREHDEVVDVVSLDQQQTDSDVIIEETFDDIISYEGVGLKCNGNSSKGPGIEVVAAGIVQQAIENVREASEQGQLPADRVQGHENQGHENQIEGTAEVEQQVAEMVQEAFKEVEKALETDKTAQENDKIEHNIAVGVVQDTDKAVGKTCDDTMAEADDEIQQKVDAKMVEKTDKAALETSQRADNHEVVQQRDASSSGFSPNKSPSPNKSGKERTKRQPCVNCGELGSSKCSKCKTPYCNKECQAKHWTVHKKDCATIAQGGIPADQPAEPQHPMPTQMGAAAKPSPRPDSPLFASKPAYVPHPQASAVHGRFLAKDIPEAKPEKAELTVMVFEITSPDCMYVQLIQRSSFQQYTQLKKLMKATYPGLPTAKELHFYLTQVGELCAAEKRGEWHRAEILSVNSPDEGVDVMLVDFGQSMRVPRNQLKRLKEDMVKLPKQGVRCFLTGICPAAADGKWTPGATELLKARILTTDKDGMKECGVVFKGYNEQKGHEINLFSNKDTKVSVSEELISAHLARPTAGFSPSPQAAPAGNQPKPILDNISEGSKLLMTLCHIMNMDVIYGFLTENNEQVAELQTRLNAPGVVNDAGQALHLPESGQLIAARYNVDNHWYRARVNNITTPEKCSVQFVDYGNREEVAIRDCRELPAQFRKQPYQALRLVLAGIQRPAEGWTEDIECAFKGWICEGHVEAMVVRKQEDHLEVELFSPKSSDPGMSFNSILADAGFTQQPAANQDKPQVSDTSSTQNVEVLEGMVVWVNDPSSFYIQIKDDAEILQALGAELPACYGNSPRDNYTPVVGDLCAALFDGCWSRGKVVECMSPVSAKVFFVDYGNESVIENDNIRALTVKFRDIPPKALVCGLDKLTPPAGQSVWSNQAIAIMKATENKLCSVQVQKVVDGKRYVQALCEDKNIGEELFQAKLAVVGQVATPQRQQPAVHSPPAPKPAPSVQVPEFQAPSGDFQALVSWMNNPSEIYIQIAAQEIIEAFGQLEAGLHSTYEALPPSSYKPQIGEICVTKSPQFGTWLRAKILESTAPNGYRVLCIDYGNDEVVSGNLHKLGEEFTKYPVTAGRGCLAGVSPSDGNQWSAQATEWLKQQIINKLVTVNCDKPNSFTITKESVNVAQQLIETGLGKPVSKEKTQAPASRPVQPAQAKPTAASKTTPAASEKAVKPVTLGTVTPPGQQTFKAYVTVVNSPSDLYIQVFDTEKVKLFQKLTNDIAVHYQNTGPSQHKFAVGNVCVAQCSAGCWCRCRVLEANEEGMAKVKFVDHGSVEDVKMAGIQPLLEQFAALPAMAIHCSLANICTPGGGETWNKEATSYLQKKIIDIIVDANVVKSTASTYDVHLVVSQRNGPSINMSQELVNMSLAKRPTRGSSPVKKDIKSPPEASTREQQNRREPQGQRSKPNIASPPGKKEDKPPLETAPKGQQQIRKEAQGQRSSRPNAVSPKQPASVPESSQGGVGKITITPAAAPDGTFDAKVIMVYYPTDFYLGLQNTSKEHMEAMQKMKADLVEHYSKAPKTGYRPEVGDFVVANRKGFWGRAKVFDIKDKFKVLFVDYGMRECLDLDDIREIEERFTQIPMMALHCGLFDISSPTGDKFWPKETVKIVQDKILGCNCKVKVKGTSPKSDITFVDLKVTMKNGSTLIVREEMINYKLALPANLSGRQKSPQAAAPKSRNMSGQRARSPNRQPMKSPSQPTKSPRGKQTDLQQTNQGAFQKYKKSPERQGSSKTPEPTPGARPKSSMTPKASEPTPSAKSVAAVPTHLKAKVPANKNFRGVVTWFNNPSSFYVLPEESAQQMTKLNDILSRYPEVQCPAISPSVGDMIVAKFDNVWCRAVIEGMSGSQAKVLFVDYGNEETVQTNALGKITGELEKFPFSVLHCAVAGVAPSGGNSWNEDAIQKLRQMVMSQLCEVHMMDPNSNVCQVNLVLKNEETSVDIRAELLKTGVAVDASTTPPSGRTSPGLAIKFPDQEVAAINRGDKIKDSSTPPSSEVATKSVKVLPKQPLPSTEFNAAVVFVNHPGSFYIHIASSDTANALAQIGTDLNSYYSQPNRQSYKPKTGELCAAQFSQDNSWYRAMAVTEGRVAKVLFVDFGNEEEVSYDVIKELSEEFHKVPVLALHCCLKGVQPSGGQWSSEVTKYMSKIMEGLCQIQIVDPSTSPVSVELTYGEASTKLSEDLISKNLAQRTSNKQGASGTKPPPQQPASRDAAVRPKQANRNGVKKPVSAQIQQAQVPEGNFQGVITWATHPGDVYLMAITKENQAIMESLNEITVSIGNSAPSQYRPLVGSACAALYKEEGQWLRAVALDYVAPNKVKVLFVDYGNSEVLECKETRKLEDKFITGIPAVAMHCSLSGVVPVEGNWSKAASVLLAQYMNQPCTISMTGKTESIPGVQVEICPMTSDGDTTPSINQQLISKGLAKASSQGELPRPSPTIPTLPSPTTNGHHRSVSRASNGSNESDVSTLHVRLTEKERQIEMQQRTLEEHRREIEELKQMMKQQMNISKR